MSEDDVQDLAEDAIQVAQRALAKTLDEEEAREEFLEKLADVRQENERLTERVAELEAKVSTDGRAYETLTRDEKVGMVREHLYKRARAGSGWFKIDYDAIRWEVFDGEPSADHCYTLMELAAAADGFYHKDPENENQYVAVDLDEANAGAAFSHANNRTHQEAR